MIVLVPRYRNGDRANIINPKCDWVKVVSHICQSCFNSHRDKVEILHFLLSRFDYTTSREWSPILYYNIPVKRTQVFSTRQYMNYFGYNRVFNDAIVCVFVKS